MRESIQPVIALPPVEFFASGRGVHSIDSPVKMRILSMLKEREMSFDELVLNLGKAKSTVSVHLKWLTSEGVVRSRSDPSDSRRKLFSMDSVFIGGASPEERVLIQGERDDILTFGEDNPGNFFRFILKTIRVTLLREGIIIDPLLQAAGYSVGQTLFEYVKAGDIEEFLSKISDFWINHILGRIEVVSLTPVIINIYDCFECISLPFLGKPACAFESGIFNGLFNRFHNGKTFSAETHCYAMGDNFCQFEIRW